jgi:hypothetical protein
MQNPRGFRVRRPLWTCPKCGLKFAGKKMAHSCGRATLAEWHARMGPKARALYDRFESLIAACGEYYVSPAKTRIAFMGRVRFANIYRINEQEMVITFALPRPLSVRRFTKIEEIVPGWFAHRMRITDPGELDGQVQRWIRRSYRTLGTDGLRKAKR